MVNHWILRASNNGGLIEAQPKFGRDRDKARNREWPQLLC